MGGWDGCAGSRGMRTGVPPSLARSSCTVLYRTVRLLLLVGWPFTAAHRSLFRTLHLFVSSRGGRLCSQFVQGASRRFHVSLSGMYISKELALSSTTLLLHG